MKLLEMFYDTTVVWTKESNICKNGIFILKPVKGTFIRNGLYKRVPMYIFNYEFKKIKHFFILHLKLIFWGFLTKMGFVFKIFKMNSHAYRLTQNTRLV